MSTPIDRMAPHSVEAEEAVLGSLLIDSEAVFRVSPFLKPEDFYIVKHRWIYEACLAMHERREPIDFVTLTEELEKRGQLAEAGGHAYISHLINVVPTAIHVEGYGRIVERSAVRRRLLQAASDIAQYAYDESNDIDETIDKSEQSLFAVSQRRQNRDLAPISDVIRSYYDRIEYLYEHRGQPLGIPTGYIDLDKLLGGMQRSDLIIVAARPGVGKTSLMLSMALNAARKFHQRVAVFSLEMSNEQLVQRMVSAETGIDSQRLRLGELREDEWPLFVEASSALGETLLFLDDTPSISAMQLRTKARRLYSEHGLDLIVIDYLQLMTGDSRSENRVQEISYISRTLKGLARELNVPVLAASQLSRSVEQRSDKRPVLSDLRESGCLAGDTLVTLADNGARVPIRELAGESGFHIWALNEQTYKLEAASVSRAFCTGRKTVYRLQTRLGRVIRATANHKFRTLLAWKRLDELQMGECVAVPHEAMVATFNTHTANYHHYETRNRSFSWISDRARQPAKASNPYPSSFNYARELTLSVSNIYWDEITSIEPDGEEDVYDLTIPGHHNFVANDFIVHNSIEQDADIVMFIYRDDLYDPDSPRKNVAEIIVAKHRNGPTGIVELYFRNHLAQFVDVTKREIAL